MNQLEVFSPETKSRNRMNFDSVDKKTITKLFKPPILHSLSSGDTSDIDTDQSLCLHELQSEDFEKTELSDLFDPAALPKSSFDQSLGTKPSTSSEEADDKENLPKEKKSNFRLKIKSPVKLLRRKKKTAKEDLDIFEEKEEPEQIDLLDDCFDKSESSTVDVLPFTPLPNALSGENLMHSSNSNVMASPPPHSLSSPKPKKVTEEDRKKSLEEVMLMLKSTAMKEQEYRPPQKALPKPSALEKRGRSIEKVKKIFSTNQKEKESDFDMSIGLRLAAKDKIDIMKGNTPIKGDSSLDGTPSKKLMMLPEKNLKNLRISLTKLSAKSPFKVKKRSDSKNGEKEFQKDDRKEEQFDHLVQNLSISFSSKSEMILRTSETEPSVHQTSLPEATDLLIHARVCALMEGYDKLLETRAKAGKRWFSFGNLVGVSRKELENLYLDAIGQKPQIPMFIGEEQQFHEPPPLPSTQTQTPPLPYSYGNPFGQTTDINSLNSFPSATSGESSKNTGNRPYPRKRSSAPQAMKPHQSTIKSLLECTDDLIVEGYFNETIGSDNNVLIDSIESSSVQVTVFSSQGQRQFIVCYRGSIGQHAKPLRSKLSYGVDPKGVNEVFGESYLAEMEQNVFNLLDRLSSENPFCDVVFTGHSFGGSLALLGATRCAERYQEMTINCHCFGVPKVGQYDFRFKAHSLPNLRIVRIEHASDYFVDLPHGPEWQHVGHTITINYSKNKKRTIVNPKGNEGETISATALAFKFGKKDQIITKTRVRSVIDPRAKKIQGKTDHEMRNYLHAVEHFTHMGSQWVRDFANEFGSGIVNAENEVRLVV